jgi:hypothetical protein
MGQHGDVALYDNNGRIGVGLEDHDAGEFTPGVRVFESILLPGGSISPVSPFDFESAEPGFGVEDGEFPPNQDVMLTPVSLEYWDGVDPVSLSPAPGVAFDFDLSGGFGTDDDGGLHAHALFGLSSPEIIADGVYVGGFVAGTAGLADSPSIYFVMLKDDLITSESVAEEIEEALELYEEGGPDPIVEGKNFAFFEEAVEYVETRAAIPEPSSVLLAVLAAVIGFVGIARHLK